MKAYTYLIFDADHTLIDFAADEKAAFRRLYEKAGVKTDDGMAEYCRLVSEKTWNDVGLSDVGEEYIQRAFHALYRSHVRLLFSRVYGRYPLPVPPEEAAEAFLKELETGGAHIDGAEETLAALSSEGSGKYKICVATNGLHGIQTGRLKALDKYFYRVYISEDVGVIKPLPAFFGHILADLGAEKEDCLMIGDSLQSDVAGAVAAGIDSCWISASTGGFFADPVAGRCASSPLEIPVAMRPTYTVSSLRELSALLGG